MSIKTSTRLGPYELIAEIGAGHMGVVWRARDPRIGRDVAIKLLPPEFASDPDRVRRFEREARTIGALNHPNLLTLHDIGTHEGGTYLVTELLEGQTLRDQIARGPLPLKVALSHAAQVARGLAAAHAKGIVHRDLKPENLFVLRDGRVKIMDFGLARPTPGRRDIAGSRSLTMTGVIVGTAGYMAPEQVRGEDADCRIDLFALGCVLYEMLSGRRPFGGTEMVETLNAVLHEEPALLSDLNPEIPTTVALLVQHCLEKDPARRCQSADDLVFEIESLAGSAIGLRPPARGADPAQRRRELIAWGAASVALIGLVIAVFARPRPQAPPSFSRLTFRRGSVSNARFSSDGATVVYSAAWGGDPTRVYTTRMDSRESSPLPLPDARLLAVSSTGELALAVGPGTSLATGDHTTLARVPLSGGAPREVAENVTQADWSPDGKELAVVRWLPDRISVEYPVGKEVWHTTSGVLSPRVSPDGNQIAFIDLESRSDFTRGYVAVLDRSGHERRLGSLWETIGGIAWSPRGDEIWFTATHLGVGKQLWAVSLSGRERLLLRTPGGVTLCDIAKDGQALLSGDDTGTCLMAHRPGQDQDRDLSWQDLTVVADISQDGQRLVFTEYSEAYGRQSVIGMRGMDGSAVVNLGAGYAGGLSPDGKWVVGTLMLPHPHLSLLPTGSGERRDLDPGPVVDMDWTDWVPDGRRVIFVGTESGHAPRVYAQDVSGGPPRPITPEGVSDGWHLVSPDSRYVLSAVGDSTFQFPLTGGAPILVTPILPRGEAIRWLADGKSLLVCDRRFNRIPLRVERLDLSTGRRQRFCDLMPPDRAGVTGIGGVMFTPDARAWAYSYFRNLSDLYLVHGLR